MPGISSDQQVMENQQKYKSDQFCNRYLFTVNAMIGDISRPD